jgi:hypothetical protein
MKVVTDVTAIATGTVVIIATAIVIATGVGPSTRTRTRQRLATHGVTVATGNVTNASHANIRTLHAEVAHSAPANINNASVHKSNSNRQRPNLKQRRRQLPSPGATSARTAEIVAIVGIVASAAVVAVVGAAVGGDAVPKVPPMPVQVTTPRLAQNPLVVTRNTASISQHHAWSRLLSHRRLRRNRNAASPPAMRDTWIPRPIPCGRAARRRAAARGAAVPVGAKNRRMSG